MDSSTIGFISACTALVASVLGPVVSLAVARRQINASVLSANREKWIETLRTMVAELISLLVAVAVVKSDWRGTWARGHGAIAANPELLQKLERMVLVRWQIRLLIDAADPEHIELQRAIDVAFRQLQSDDLHASLTEADVKTITRLSQAILARAWRRVKEGT